MAESSASTSARLQGWGAAFLALGAATGAMGAHALEDVLTPDRLESWSTASVYLLVMGAGVMGAASSRLAPRECKALRAVVVGTAVFSGSIFGLVGLVSIEMGAGLRAVLGPLTPMGGVAMIAGWSVLAWSRFRNVIPSESNGGSH